MDSIHQPTRSKKDCLWWSIPSVVLASISIVLGNCSYWFVQPNIQQRYREICERNLRILQIGDLELNGTALKTDLLTKSESNGLSDSDSRKLFEETLLCLKRLIVWDNADDSLRFRTAIVSERFADLLLEQSRAMYVSQEIDMQLRELIPRANSEHRNAMNSMRAVAMANGPLAKKATLWLVRHRLDDDAQTEAVALDSLERELRTLIDDDLLRSFANQTLGEILVRKSLGATSILEPGERIALLREADLLYQANFDSDLRTMAWAAEAKSAIDPGAAKEIAWKAAQSFWTDGDTPFSSPEMLAAVVDCLLMTGSFKEAQGFVVKRLATVASFDQPVFKKRAADACLRSVMANTLHDWAAHNTKTNPGEADISGSTGTNPNAPEESAYGSGSRVIALLSMAIQLQPESPDLLALIEEVASHHKVDDWMNELYREIQNSNDVALRQLVLAIEAIVAEDDTFDFDVLGDAVKGALAYGVVASKLALKLAERESVNHELLVRILMSINHSAPELLIVWSDRASLHLKKQQYDSALDCMKFLKEKLPDNKNIIESIQEIEQNRK